jgi:hypothetical protein
MSLEFDPAYFVMIRMLAEFRAPLSGTLVAWGKGTINERTHSMRRLSTAVLVALVPLLGSSIAQAERPYSTRPEVARPETVRAERPVPTPYQRPEVSRTNESTGPTRCIVDCKTERPIVTMEHTRPDALRPDAKRDAFVPAEESGDKRGVMSNREVKQGKPALRPDAKRDAFMPVNEETGRPRSINANREVRQGMPALRHDAKREAFLPVNEETGRARALDANHEVKKGKPALRPDAKRETFRPATDTDGNRSEIHRILCHVSAQCK